MLSYLHSAAAKWQQIDCVNVDVPCDSPWIYFRPSHGQAEGGRKRCPPFSFIGRFFGPRHFSTPLFRSRPCSPLHSNRGRHGRKTSLCEFSGGCSRIHFILSHLQGKPRPQLSCPQVRKGNKPSPGGKGVLSFRPCLEVC